MGTGMGQGLGKKIDWQKLMPPRGGVGGSASALGGGAHLLLVGAEQEAELRDYERLCASEEAFVYAAAMIRLMVRRLARG